MLDDAEESGDVPIEEGGEKLHRFEFSQIAVPLDSPVETHQKVDRFLMDRENEILSDYEIEFDDLIIILNDLKRLNDHQQEIAVIIEPGTAGRLFQTVHRPARQIDEIGDTPDVVVLPSAEIDPEKLIVSQADECRLIERDFSIIIF
jgi:hypothetical protein